MSALSELQKRHDAVEDARRVVADAQAATSPARSARRAHQARDAVRRYHAAIDAGAHPDSERERQLTADLTRVQAEIVEVDAPGGGVNTRDLAAEQHHANAQLALEDAVRELDGYLWTHAPSIAHELVDQAREIAHRYRPVATQVVVLERECATLTAVWSQVLEPLGLHPDDLPESPVRSGRFASVMPPMPIPLMDPDEMSPIVRARAEAIAQRNRLDERDAAAAADLAEQQAADSDANESASGAWPTSGVTR